MLSSLDIKRFARQNPHNLLFATDDELCSELSRSVLQNEKAQLLAEVFIRAFLTEDPALIGLLEKQLPDGEWQQFQLVAPKAFHTRKAMDRIPELWRTDKDFSICCRAIVRKRLIELFSVDGFIPLYLKGDAPEAFLLPFQWLETARPSVVDDCGKEIPPWSAALAELEIPAQMRILATQTDSMPPFAGRSMMLPALMAWWRREDQLPPYDIFRVVASGAFEDGRLSQVQTEEKIRAIRQIRKKFIFFCPESEFQNQVDHRVYLLPSISKTRLLPRLCDELELLDHTSPQYAMNRLPSLEEMVRRGFCRDWDDLIVRLRANAVFYEDENPREYLVNLMLQTEACCHCGKTLEARRIIEKALAFAATGGKFLRYFALRLEIEKLILAIDVENFNEIKLLAEPLARELNEFNDDDLLMRFNGTMGQAHAFGDLAGRCGFSRETAKSCFSQALGYARKSGRLEDIRQDTNYFHLWHVLFALGSPEEQDAWRDAWKQFMREDNDNRDRNMPYLLRQQAFAWYRFRLQTGKIPDYTIDDNMQCVLNQSSWLSALIGKYLGALEAASGRTDAALQLFENACKKISAETTGVLAVLRMTICTQAWDSLKGTRFDLQAETYRREALRALETHVIDKIHCNTHLWRDFLMKKTGESPYLKYWY